MSTAVIWSISKPDVEFQYGGRLSEFNAMSSHSYLTHCRVLPLNEFTVVIPEPHATLQWRRQDFSLGGRGGEAPKIEAYFMTSKR